MAVKSKQEQYKKGDGEVDFVNAMRRFMASAKELNSQLPPYKADTRKRDKALGVLARSENILSGVLSTVVSRNANRPFSLIGGTRQVSKYSTLLHDVNKGEGWTDFVTKLCTSYYSSNFGYAAEIGFDKQTPASMFSFDPTRTRLLGVGGDKDGYLLYNYPRNHTNPEKFKQGQYIHDNSMPSIERDLKNAGLCAVERAITATKIISGVMQYYLEKLSVAPSQGIVHFKGIDLEDFEKAVKMAEEQNKAMSYEIYKGVLALFTESTVSDINLVSFSSLPEQFEFPKFIEIVLQIYALAFNYPVGQFWSIGSGSFGRTGEMKVQEQMATEKGELEFAISLQQQLHKHFLPEALTFKFDVRNDSGDLIKESIRTERIAQAVELVNANILTTEQARSYLAENGDIPSQWAESIDDTVEADLSIVRENFRRYALENSSMVSRLIKTEEPIISYTWNPSADFFGTNLFDNDFVDRGTIESIYSNKFPNGTINVVYRSLEEVMRKRNF